MNNLDVMKEYREKILNSITDFTTEFEGLKGIKPSGEGNWMVALCPFHSDKNQSFGFNTRTGVWNCFSMCGKGDLFTYRINLFGTSFKDELFRLGDKYGIPRPASKEAKPFIKESQIKTWINNLWANKEVVRWLQEKRGLSEQTLKKHCIGWDTKRQRNTIPVRDEKGNVVNVRLYNAKKSPKMINFVDGKFKYGSPARLYGLDEMRDYQGDSVFFCEGEFDRLLLQQEGFMALTGTAGASTFRPEWGETFKGKNAILILDCDDPGQAAAKTIMKVLKKSEAKSIKNIVLPLKGDKSDKDITDFLHKRSLTGADLRKIINETPVHIFEEDEKPEKIINVDSFVEIEKEGLIDKKISVPITICGETSEAFHAVEEIKIGFCQKMEKGGCNECKGSLEPVKIPRGAQEYIGACMTSNVQLIHMLREYCCKYGQKPRIDILDRTTIKEFFCHQKVTRITQSQDDKGEETEQFDGKKQELVEKRVYYISSDHPKPGSYQAVGWVKSHPKTQQVTLLIESMEPLEDDFESFNLKDSAHHLKAFQALTWEEKVEDLNRNVTRIYKRDEILLSVLLNFCSPRWIPFNGEIIRGWIISAIIGDSGSGKTQTYSRISEYINIGDTFSSLTGSRTGLAYAIVEHKQKGWQVKVGRYPANSRKILMVDEAQILTEFDIKAIAKAMDEGFLQIDRVQSQGYESQTRLLLIANPKGDKTMDTFSFGCESLKKLFPILFIRRTDFVIFTNSGDLGSLAFINQRVGHSKEIKISPEMLRAVVYWAWNIRPDKITFEKEAEEVCLRKAEEMSNVFGFTDDIPLVPRSDFRKKLARVSAAFAVLEVSANEDFSRLIVTKKQVERAAWFLNQIYSHQNCGLDQYSSIQKMFNQVTDYDAIKDEFLSSADNSRFDGRGVGGTFQRLVFLLHINQKIKRDDLSEQLDCKPETVTRGMKVLKRFNLIDSTKDGYMKKPKFNKFLSRFKAENPDFLTVE